MKKKISFIGIAFMFVQYGFSMELVESPQPQSKITTYPMTAIEIPMEQVDIILHNKSALLNHAAGMVYRVDMYIRSATTESKKELLSTLSVIQMPELCEYYGGNTEMPRLIMIDNTLLDDCLHDILYDKFAEAESIISKLDRCSQKTMEEKSESKNKVWIVTESFFLKLRGIFEQHL